MTIYLRPGRTGKGTGGAAMNRLEEAAKDAGIHVLVCTLSADNGASIRLCEKTGYEKVAHLKRIGEKFGKVLDVVIYQKEL